MKTPILFFLTILSLVGCSKEDPQVEDPLAKLPPETQIGANTFGCIINNQVFYPRDGTSSLFNPAGKGLILWGAPGGTQDYDELEIRNLQDAKPANSMIIHLQNLHQLGIGEYVWKVSNFQSSIDGLMQNYVYAKIYDDDVKGWRFYGSYENSGKVVITKYDFTNRLICGTFSGRLRLRNSTQEIDIVNGRFDIKWSTLETTRFP
jgi:hypothetical protein